MNHTAFFFALILLSHLNTSTCSEINVDQNSNKSKQLYHGARYDPITNRRIEVLGPTALNGSNILRQTCSYTYQYSDKVYSEIFGSALPSVSLECSCGRATSEYIYVLQGENVTPCVKNCFSQYSSRSCSQTSESESLFEGCCSDCSGNAANMNAFRGRNDWAPLACFEGTPPTLQCELKFLDYSSPYPKYFDSNGYPVSNFGLQCACANIGPGWSVPTAENGLGSCFSECLERHSGVECNNLDTSMISPSLTSCCTSCGGSYSYFPTYFSNRTLYGERYGCIAASQSPISSPSSSPSTNPFIEKLRIDTSKPPKDNTKTVGENIKLEVEKELGRDVNLRTKVGKYKSSLTLRTYVSFKGRRLARGTSLVAKNVSRPFRNCLPNKNCAARIIVTSGSTMKKKSSIELTPNYEQNLALTKCLILVRTSNKA